MWGFFIKCGQNFENVGNVGPLGTLHTIIHHSCHVSDFFLNVTSCIQLTAFVLWVKGCGMRGLTAPNYAHRDWIPRPDARNQPTIDGSATASDLWSLDK